MSIAHWTGLIDVDREQYYSPEQKYFCLMWENHHSTSVRMNLEYIVKQQESGTTGK